MSLLTRTTVGRNYNIIFIIKEFKGDFIILKICVHVCVVSEGACVGQKHPPLELETQGTVSCLVWVLGTALRSLLEQHLILDLSHSCSPVLDEASKGQIHSSVFILQVGK